MSPPVSLSLAGILFWHSRIYEGAFPNKRPTSLTTSNNTGLIDFYCFFFFGIVNGDEQEPTPFDSSFLFFSGLFFIRRL